MTIQDTAVTIGKILHPIGIACSCLVLVVLISLAFIEFKHVNRMTIRLISAIALADFITHISELVSVGTKDYVGQPYCEGLSALRHFGRLFYCFTNLAISFHLYRVYAQLKNPSFKFELIFWFVLILVVGLLMTIFYFMGIYTGTVGKIACSPGSNNPIFTLIMEIFNGCLGLVTIVVCVYVTFIGRRNISNWIKLYENSQVAGNDTASEFKNQRRKIAERAFLYPLSTIITIPAPAILSFMIATKNISPQIFIVMAIGTGLSGVLTALVFGIDPSIRNSIKIAKIQIGNRKKGTQTEPDIEMSPTGTLDQQAKKDLDLYFDEIKNM